MDEKPLMAFRTRPSAGACFAEGARSAADKSPVVFLQTGVVGNLVVTQRFLTPWGYLVQEPTEKNQSPTVN